VLYFEIKIITDFNRPRQYLHAIFTQKAAEGTSRCGFLIKILRGYVLGYLLFLFILKTVILILKAYFCPQEIA
jgi:hypothetical protein